jgi:hypothetical protein
VHAAEMAKPEEDEFDFIRVVGRRDKAKLYVSEHKDYPNTAILNTKISNTASIYINRWSTERRKLHNTD